MPSFPGMPSWYDQARQWGESTGPVGFGMSRIFDPSTGTGVVKNRAFANFPGNNGQSPLATDASAFGYGGGFGGGGSFGSGFNYGSSVSQGGIGTKPPGVSTTPPKTAQQQIFNRPAYQRNRVTTGQMAEMERANADRYRAEVMPLQTAFNRSWNAANQQQRFNETAAANQAANQFFDLANNYQNQQYGLNQASMQMLMPLMGQFFNV